ncbi:MAG: hypothetical protein KDA20_13520 [Phycisphaerales bacterium]|nr:hypothetical protein [Phycisphaerales bacterium]
MLITRSIADALRARAHELDEEHATLGIDALDELPLHPILCAGLETTGLGVLREQRYPASRAVPKRSIGDRCDIVLIRAPDTHLTDPLQSGTLFAEQGVAPEDALWLEVKLAAQFAMSDGWSRANPLYSGVMLTQTMADIRKLASESAIHHAALVLIMFNTDEPIASHDLSAWYQRCIERGLPISAPITHRFAITDRIGNAVATIALVRVHQS